MRLTDGGRVHRVLARARNSIAAPALILVYHRIAEEEVDPWGCCVSPSHFAEHLDVLRRYFRPVALSRLVTDARLGTLARGSVAITFDDGYRDNRLLALAALDRCDVPATFFVTTRYIGLEREFWWDTLSRMVLSPKQLPERLVLNLASRSRSWSLSDRTRRQQGDGRGQNNVKAWQAEPDSRLGFYYSVWRELRTLPNEAQEHALRNIADWSGEPMEPVKFKPDQLPFSPDDMFVMQKSGLVEFGSHSVSHAHFPSLSPEQQRAEIENSKVALQDIIGDVVDGFSYPFGEWSPETPRFVSQAGFSFACSLRRRSVTPQVEPYALPRISIENWDGHQLRWNLAGVP